MRKRITYTLWDTEKEELVPPTGYTMDEIIERAEYMNHSVCSMVETEDGYTEYVELVSERYKPVKVTIEDIE